MIAPLEASRAELDDARSKFRDHALASFERQETLNAASASEENESRMIEGIGQLDYRIDQGLYWHMVGLYGRDIWKDPRFKINLERAGVIHRVKAKSDKIWSIGAMSQPSEKLESAKVKSGNSSDPTFSPSHLPTFPPLS